MNIRPATAANATLLDVHLRFGPYVGGIELPEPEQDLANVRLLIAKAIENR